MLAKSLTGGPAGYTGPFSINYSCTKTGEPTLADTVSVASGSQSSPIQVPTGYSCTVSEPNLPNANSTPPAPTGYSFGNPTFSPSATVPITTEGATVTVTTVNTMTRDTGNLKILKDLKNDEGAPVPATFSINYVCTFDGQETANSTATISPGDPGATVQGIPTGSECTITEVTPKDIPGYTWGAVTYSPRTTVVETKGATYTVQANNVITKNRGTFTIEKALTNDDGAPVPSSFTVNYNCGFDTDGKTALTGQKSIAPGSPATVSGIPTGNSCSVTEVAPAPIAGYTWASPITYTPSSIEIGEGEGPFAITVGNAITKNRGTFTIEKALTNDDGAPVPSSFTVNYNCGFDTDGKTALTGQKSIAPGSPATVSGIPTGNSCSVTEVAPAPIAGYTWASPITYTPSSIEIGEGKGPFAITVGNTITKDRGSLTVTKVLTGSVPEGFASTFDIDYDCGVDTDRETAISGTLTLAGGKSETVSGIPTGNTCTITESGLPTLPQYYSWVQSPSYGNNQESTPANVVEIVTAPTAAVTVTNTVSYNPPPPPPPPPGWGGLSISKVVTGGPAGYVGPFDIQYSCTSGGPSGTASVTAGVPFVINNIPNGSVCTVSENTLPQAPTGYFWSSQSDTGGTVTISTGRTSSVTVTNGLSPIPVAQAVISPQPATVAVPAKATLPAAVPAGGGAMAQRNDALVGAVLLLFIGLVGAGTAATRRRLL